LDSDSLRDILGARKVSSVEDIVKRIALLLASIFLVAPAVLAQDWAQAKLEKSPRHHEWATVKHGDRSVETYVAYPEAKDKRPVVVVIHEIFGLTDWAQNLADEVAEAGYIAVAPDLLSGMGPNGGRTNSYTSQSDATAAVGKLDADQITADLNAVADYGLKLPSSSGKLYVAGFCWGGGQTFRFATNRMDLAGAFSFYGPPPPKDAMARIKAPVYGFYAGNDARIGAMIPDATAAMKELGKKYEPVTYDGAGHGFMRAGEAPPPTDASQQAAYDANVKARNDAWARWKSLMSH
jgi:carboxymethylenebutenolidase